MINLPADIANQALDAIGVDYTIGDLQEGTREAQVLLRAYGQRLRQLLRSAPWVFARREAPMLLLADATLPEPAFVNGANIGNIVPQGFRFEYAYPDQCMKLRFVPWRGPGPGTGVPAGNIVPPNAGAPPTTAPTQRPSITRFVPSRFVITNDMNYPPAPGQEWWNEHGVSPTGRAVVLSNVQEAHAVYTVLVEYPNVWDAMFREAFVAYLASGVCMALHTDKKLAMAIRRDQEAIVKDRVKAARLMDGNEGTPTTDIRVDWMDVRRTGGDSGHGYWGGAIGAAGAGGDGGYGGGFDAIPLASGAVF